jgi:cytochrome P450
MTRADDHAPDADTQARRGRTNGAAPDGEVVDFDPLDVSFLRDPYPMMARLRAESPVHYVEHLNIWAVSRHDDVAAIVRSPSVFSSELGLGRGWTLTDDRPPAKEMSFQAGIPGVRVLIGADAPAHSELRQLLAPCFNRSRLDALRRQIELVTDDLLVGLVERAEDGPVDIVSGLAQPLASASLGLALGLPDETTGLLTGWVRQVSHSWNPAHPDSHASSYRRLARAGWDMLRELRTVLRSPSRVHSGGAVDVLLEAHRRDPSALTEMEVLSNIVLLVLAGVHTTTCGMASSMQLLASDPALVDALRADESLVPAFVDEALRLESPIQASWRGTWSDREIGGQPVPEGARILLMFGSASRDEAHYVAPSELRLGRRERSLTFGAGPHTCIGGLLAVTEIRGAVHRVCQRLESLDVAGSPIMSTNLIVRGPEVLPLALTRAMRRR